MSSISAIILTTKVLNQSLISCPFLKWCSPEVNLPEIYTSCMYLLTHVQYITMYNVHMGKYLIIIFNTFYNTLCNSNTLYICKSTYVKIIPYTYVTIIPYTIIPYTYVTIIPFTYVTIIPFTYVTIIPFTYVTIIPFTYVTVIPYTYARVPYVHMHVYLMYVT